jgi:Taurine catabolism dioxygenase TauD, TfdA family
MAIDTAPSTPQPVRGPSVWYGRDLADRDDWVYRLSETEIEEIDAAVDVVQQRGLPMRDVTRSEFPLPSLGSTLDALRDEVVNGRGFVLLRGLPVEGRNREAAALGFWGIGAYFGKAVSQNAQGHLLGHVKDLGRDPTRPDTRLYQTNARHRYHTDSSDIVALLCLKTAKRGGASSIVSSTTIYNEMLVRQPDLVAELLQPLAVDRKDEIPEGKQPFYRMAVFHWYEDTLSTIYARDFIEGAQRFSEAPRLSDHQIAAMDLLDQLASDPSLRLDMILEPGDMQFLHNHQILHARTAYEDHVEPERKRHLLRLWLSPPNGRPLPEVFAERYGSVNVGRRGGIQVPGTLLVTPLEAEIAIGPT